MTPPIRDISFAWDSQVTTDAFVDLARTSTILDPRSDGIAHPAISTVQVAWEKTQTKTATIVVRNTGANSGTYQVFGSVDGVTFDQTLQASAPVASGANAQVDITTFFPYVKIQVKSTVASTPTTFSAVGVAIQT